MALVGNQRPLCSPLQVIDLMRFNQTATIFSPLVSLSGTWGSTDFLQPWPSRHSSSHGDVVSFSFNGSAATIYGSTNGTASVFSVSVDNGKPITVSGQSPSTSTSFQQPVLYTLGSLSSDTHTIRIANLHAGRHNGTGDGSLSISALEWVMDLGQNSTTLTTVDDADPSATISWRPTDTAWMTGACSSLYYHGSCHLTYTRNASVSFTFAGSAISVFGGTNDDHGRYSVAVDDGEAAVYRGFSSELRVKQLLAHATVSAGVPHTITITNMDQAILDIDYFQIFGNESTPIMSTPISPPITNQTNHTGDELATGTHPAHILGPVIGTLGALFFIGILVFLWWRRRRERMSCSVEPWYDSRNDNVSMGAAVHLNSGSAAPLLPSLHQTYPWSPPHTVAGPRLSDRKRPSPWHVPT